MTDEEVYRSASIHEIEGLLEALATAVSSADLETLRGLVEEEVTWIFSGDARPVRGAGRALETWARHLAKWQNVSIRRRDTSVRVRGDLAWGCFVWDGEGSAAGHRYLLEGERWSVTMVREGGVWLFTQVHSSMPYRNWKDHRTGV